MPETFVHYMKYGHTACLQNGPPSSWPDGHKWSGDWNDVTCLTCRAGRELIPTFTISKEGDTITCLRCKRTSHHPQDVENHYCGWCCAYHDDIWPPARRAWLATPPPTNPPGHGKGEVPTAQG